LRICLVSSRVLHSEQGEAHFAISNSLLKYLGELGVSSVPVSSLTADLEYLFDTLTPSLIVLSGGESIGESSERDIFETRLLTLAKQRKTPVLGICRGMQVIGSFVGADLVGLENHIGIRHPVEGTFTGEVNSFHRFGFAKLPVELETLATCIDGTIEAFIERDLRWLGLMWHPEREAKIDRTELQTIKSLVGIL